MSSTEGALTLRERKKLLTRGRLLAAAEDLFAAKGYHATTMDEIAARADVARATAFNYFPRKEEFLAAWVEQRRDALVALLGREEDEPVDTATRLGHAFGELGSLLEAQPQRNRALIRAWLQAGGHLLPGADATAPVFAQTIRHGQVAGDIRPDVDATHAGYALLDLYVGALIRWANDESPRHGIHEPLQAAVDVAIRGLATHPPARRRASA
jgi:AcrR family transcriptional regulator